MSLSATGDRRLRHAFAVALLLLPGMPAVFCAGQAAGREKQTGGKANVPALLLSDVHFDPFHDPAKVAQLAAAPVSGWSAILAAPASGTQAKDFDALQETCHVRGVDTSDALWRASLAAIHAEAEGAAFAAYSGDLLTHGFECKFKQTMPEAREGEYLLFVEKTIRYVVESLRGALPGVPVYAAMGNNDSGCGDYKDDPDSAFLRLTAKIVAEALPVGGRAGTMREFARGGFYSAAFPARFPRARMLVLDSIFLSAKHGSCAGKPDETAAERQIAWLEGELDRARERGEHVWVLGHIPPGVDLYATARKMGNLCGKTTPQMFLGNERLAEVLAAHADVVRLAVFGHSHTDELRLLMRESTAGKEEASRKPGGLEGAHGAGTPVKIVASISPVNGNNPSFTVARVDPGTATMVDYTVFAASDTSGGGWNKEYTFSEAYHLPAFNASTLAGLTASLRADTTGSTPESGTYLRGLFVGDRSLLLKALWPEYGCAFAHDSAASFTNCVCGRDAAPGQP